MPIQDISSVFIVLSDIWLEAEQKQTVIGEKRKKKYKLLYFVCQRLLFVFAML